MEGSITLDEFMKNLKYEEFLMQYAPILEGGCNSTLSKETSKIIKRLNPSNAAYNELLKLNDRCVPPYDDSENKIIWNSAIKFYQGKVISNTSYIKSDDYNQKTIR